MATALAMTAATEVTRGLLGGAATDKEWRFRAVIAVASPIRFEASIVSMPPRGERAVCFGGSKLLCQRVDALTDQLASRLGL